MLCYLNSLLFHHSDASVSHWELPFAYDLRSGSYFILYHVTIPLASAVYLKDDPFNAALVCWPRIKSPLTLGSVSELSVASVACPMPVLYYLYYCGLIRSRGSS